LNYTDEPRQACDNFVLHDAIWIDENGDEWDHRTERRHFGKRT
jgi:hypothetical protein